MVKLYWHFPGSFDDMLPDKMSDHEIQNVSLSSATNRPHNQNFCTQCIKILKDMSHWTWKDSSDHFYTPADHVQTIFWNLMAGHLEKPKVEVLKQSIQIWGALDCCRHLFWSFFYGFETHELSFKCDYWTFSEISWPDIKSKIELDGGGYRFDLINFFIWITLFPIDRYISK